MYHELKRPEILGSAHGAHLCPLYGSKKKWRLFLVTALTFWRRNYFFNFSTHCI